MFQGRACSLPVIRPPEFILAIVVPESKHGFIIFPENVPSDAAPSLASFLAIRAAFLRCGEKKIHNVALLHTTVLHPIF
jgi:hypothetical protein